MSLPPDNRPTPVTAFDHALKAFLDDFFAAQPVWATQIGFHAHDDRWPDMTEAGRSARLAMLRDHAGRLGALASTDLSADEQIDRGVVAEAIEGMIFEDEELREHAWDSLSYVWQAGSGLFGLLGLVGLIWASTRLFGSLRTVLEIIFEIPPEERLGIVQGKIHDVRMVVVVGSMFLLTISLTTALRWLKNYGVGFLGLGAYNISWFWTLMSMIVAYLITYLMFFFVYRYVPDRWIPRQDAAVAALFSSLLFELAKLIFVSYLAEISRFMELYGSFTNLVLVAFWVYYSSVVFILGGELARIVQVQRGRGSRPGWSFREVSP